MSHHMEKLVREEARSGSDNKQGLVMGHHMERLVREVAASAFSSTIGDVGLVFQGGQQVFCCSNLQFFYSIFQIRAHRSLLCLVSQQWRSLLEFCSDSEVFISLFFPRFAQNCIQHFLSKASNS